MTKRQKTRTCGRLAQEDPPRRQEIKRSVLADSLKTIIGRDKHHSPDHATKTVTKRLPDPAQPTTEPARTQNVFPCGKTRFDPARPSETGRSQSQPHLDGHCFDDLENPAGCDKHHKR